MTFDELDEQQTKAALYVLELPTLNPLAKTPVSTLPGTSFPSPRMRKDATAGIWTTKATKHASR